MKIIAQLFLVFAISGCAIGIDPIAMMRINEHDKIIEKMNRSLLKNSRGFTINVAAAKNETATGYQYPTTKTAQDSNLATTIEIKISQVIAGSAADLAGLKVGDLIIEVNNKKTYSYLDVATPFLADTEQMVTLTLVRDGKNLYATMKSI